MDDRTEELSADGNDDKFTARQFYKSLDSTNQDDEHIRCLKVFCSKAKGFVHEDNYDIVRDFLEIRNSYSRLINLLQDARISVEKTTHIFKALHIILFRITDDLSQFEQTGRDTAYHLLQQGLGHFCTLLDRRQPRQGIKASLKLLTVVVVVGFANDLASQISVLTRSLCNIANLRKFEDSEDIHTCLVHFIMSFFVVGINSVIQQICLQKDILITIFLGLPYDKASIIQPFLATFKTKVLENSSISKTLKIKILNQGTLGAIFGLLRWKGPKTLTDKKLLKKTKRADEAWILHEASNEEVQTVRESAYHFLLVACSSHKYGIVFHGNPELQGGNPNFTMTKVLQSQTTAFEDEQSRELVAQILCCCPDLTFHYLAQIQNSFEPRLSLPWCQAMTFITRMASLQNMEGVVVRGSIGFSIRRVQNALGISVLKKATIFSALRSPENLLKLMMTKWLVVVFEKIQHILGLQKEDPDSVFLKVGNELKGFLPNLSDILETHLPKEGHQAQISQQNLPEGTDFSIADYLNATVDLLSLLSGGSTSLGTEDPTAFSRLFALIQKHQTALDEEITTCLHLKVLRMIARDNAASNFWQNETESLCDPLNMLFDLYIRVSDEKTLSTLRELVSELFAPYQVFEGYDWELELWFQELRDLPTRRRHHAAALLCNALRAFFRSPNEFVDKVMECQLKAVGMEEDPVDIDISTQDFLKMCEKQSMLSVNNEEGGRGSFFSPLVPAVLSTLSDSKNIKENRLFIQSTLLKVLHCQRQPEAICILIHEFQDVVTKFLLHYTSLWHPQLANTKANLARVGGFWHDYSKKLCESEKEASAGECLSSAFVHLYINGNRLEGSDAASFLSKSVPTSQSQAKELLSQSLLYLQTQLTSLVKRKARDEDVVFVLCSYVDNLVSILCSSCPDDVSKLQIIENVLSHVLFKTWFLTFSDSEFPDRPVESETNFSQLLTILSCKYLSQVCNLANNNNQDVPSVVALFKTKLISVTKIVFKSENERLATLWENIKLGVASCLPIFTCNEVTELLNNVFCLPVCEMVVLRDVFDVLQVLLKAFMERNEKSTLQGLKTKTVKDMFELVCLDSATKARKNFELSLLDLLEQFPVFCAVISTSVFQNTLQNNSLSLVRVLSIHNAAHLQTLRTHLQHHEIPWDDCSTLSCLLTLKLVLDSSDLNTKEDKVHMKRLSLVFWKKLGSVIIDDVSTDEELELDITDTLNGLLRKGLIKRSSLVSQLHAITQKNLSNPSPPTLSTLAILTQVYDCVLTSLPDLKMEGCSLRSCWLTMLLDWLQIILKDPESSNLLLLEFCSETLSCLQTAAESEIQESLQRSSPWLQMATNILRKGMKCSVTGPSLMMLLKELCAVMYADKTASASPTVAELYRLIVNHSAFASIMVDEEGSLVVMKEPLVDLMTVLVKLDGASCSTDHFPVLLGAYRATLSSMDQKLLYLMNVYEEKGSSMHGYRPFKWGPTAVAYYYSQASTRLALWKQPKIQDIVQLLDKEKLLRTALHFPLDLQLKPKENPVLSVPSDSTEDDLYSLYDPRFLLLVLNHFLQPGSVVDCETFITSHCLSLVFSSLSCNDDDLRTLGYNTLGLFYQHLEGVWNTFSKIWTFVLDALRNGLQYLNARLPCIITTFLIRSTDVILMPNDPLYSVISKFLALKPVLDIVNVPEFYTLFYSSDVSHRNQRTWILSLIQDGLRSTLDFHLCQKRFIFPILLSFCTSEISPGPLKVQILCIVRAAVCFRSAALSLCKAQGLMTWIQSMTVNHIPEKQESEILSEIILILDQLWTTSTVQNGPKRQKQGRRGNATTELEKTELENEEGNSDNDSDVEVEKNLDLEPMDTIEVAEPSSPMKSTFYSSFANELLLVCLTLLDKIGSKLDIKIVSKCLKLCHNCFTSLPDFKPFLPYLTDSHLQHLLTYARRKPNVDTFSTTSDITIQRECRYYATKILLLVPPKRYLGTQNAGPVFQVVIDTTEGDMMDMKFLWSVSEWFTNCVKYMEDDEVLRLFASESNCAEVLLRWISNCVALRTTQNASDLGLLGSLVKLFLVLLPFKHTLLAEACRAVLEREATAFPDANYVLTLAAIIQETWLEDSVSKKLVRKFQPFATT